MGRPRTRKKKLAVDSLRDTEWQEEEYARQMGVEKAAEQVRAARLAKGLCVCNRRTIKNHGVFRTIHERDCTKWKPWMEEYENVIRLGRWPSSDQGDTL